MSYDYFIMTISYIYHHHFTQVIMQIDKCKILLLGESAVGKTSIFRRFAGNPNDKVTPTIGAQYKQKIITTSEGKQIKIQLWDTAGTQRYRTISSIYYRNLDGVLLVFDITDQNSFKGLDYWIDELNEKGQDAQIVMVGNKNDQEDRRQVTRQRAQSKAKELKIVYAQTSALDEEIIQSIFKELVERIVEKRERPVEMGSKRSSFQELRVSDLPRKAKKEDDCC